MTAAESYESLHPGAVPRVDVCPGRYDEQVTISKSLVLTRAPVAPGQGAATIELPASVGSSQAAGLSSTNCQATDTANKVQPPQSVIEVCAARAGGGNNYTGPNNASSAGILVFGGCGRSLVDHASVTGNTLTGNDIGVGLFSYDPTCVKPASSPTRNLACFNVIKNASGYPGGQPSAGANRTGWTGTTPAVGYQAGVADVGKDDVICANAISGAGFAPLGTTSSLPNPAPPAFVRPIDTVTGPAITPSVFANTFDGRPYLPS